MIPRIIFYNRYVSWTDYVYSAMMIYINLKNERTDIMRVVWHDSKQRTYKPVKYRKHMIYGSPKGWTTSLPNDANIYATHYDALNAIDKALGGHGQMGGAKRQKYGINIIGTKGGEETQSDNTPKI